MDNAKIEQTAKFASKKFQKEPLFMFLCPDPEAREEFIYRYFLLYLENWVSDGSLIIAKSGDVMCLLRDPESIEPEVPSGKETKKLRKITSYPVSGGKIKSYKRIAEYREVLNQKINMLLPPDMGTKVLSVFAGEQIKGNDLSDVIKNIDSLAKSGNFTVMYETISKRFINTFLSFGYDTAFNRQFLETQFIQTVMIKSPKSGE